MKTVYTILHKCVLVILAIQLLNMSLGNPDNTFIAGTPCQVSAGNRIDSGFEFLTENLLGWDNYFPESSSNKNHQAGHLHKTSFIYCCTSSISDFYIQLDRPSAKLYPLALSSLIPGHKDDINPPPPKA